MAKKKSVKKVSYSNAAHEHLSAILLLAGGLVVVLCLYFLDMDKFMPTKVFSSTPTPTTQVTQPMNEQMDMSVTVSPSPSY